VLPSQLEKGTTVDVEVTGPGALPSSFPADIPPYPGAEASGGMSVPGQPMAVQFESNDGAQQIYDFYLAQLPSNGWQITEEHSDDHRLKAIKASREVSVVLHGAGGKTQVGIMLSGD
jgi:hypothetical protein